MEHGLEQCQRSGRDPTDYPADRDGVVLVVFAIIRWLWDCRRSGFQGNHAGLLWTFGVGAVLAAPDVVIPLLLGLADLITNAVIGLFGGL